MIERIGADHRQGSGQLLEFDDFGTVTRCRDDLQLAGAFADALFRLLIDASLDGADDPLDPESERARQRKAHGFADGWREMTFGFDPDFRQVGGIDEEPL